LRRIELGLGGGKFKEASLPTPRTSCSILKMAGSYSRNKGRRLEQELVNLLKEGGLDAHRISMIETGHFAKGDLLINKKWKAEVKGGEQVPKFLYNANKEGEEILFMKRDRLKWKVCIDLDWFLEHLSL
jgi:hypothetical protein